MFFGFVAGSAYLMAMKLLCFSQRGEVTFEIDNLTAQTAQAVGPGRNFN